MTQEAGKIRAGGAKGKVSQAVLCKTDIPNHADTNRAHPDLVPALQPQGT